jgi:catechol 2,3-dioxygenase-like lactoylglutathione lyase family enzyme
MVRTGLGLTWAPAYAATVSVLGFDHVAITVADVDATLDWYQRVLDAQPIWRERWASGELPVAFLQVGAARISVHPAHRPAAPHAAAPTPGSADLCFRWAGPIAGAIARLVAAGVAVEDGPVPRPASSGERGLSVYFRDPDGNLLELLSVDG